jgi:hypothetical protein
MARAAAVVVFSSGGGARCRRRHLQCCTSPLKLRCKEGATVAYVGTSWRNASCVAR